ncbi:tyrosine-type recombinase/integrase [Phytomonospora sp. NPDC050363]|uniref:tyrosine-type recombinase/integrase n=1 Tax=Phytomonospora sp. NPDC050363 TaxID=3155642 RepID=UPI0033C37B15
MYARIRQVVSPALFAAAEHAAQARGVRGEHLREALNNLSTTVLLTGKDLDEVTGDDLIALSAHARSYTPKYTAGSNAAWQMMTDIGVFPVGSTRRQAMRTGQKTTAELVDAYGIENRPIRDLLVRYLDEHRPCLDYGSLVERVRTVSKRYWREIELLSPGIATLEVPREVIAAWKDKLAFIDGDPLRPRIGFATILTMVRAFYLDIQEWALEDPTWAPWVARCPISRNDTEGLTKTKKATTARMHQRVRDRLPHLPRLVASAEDWKADQTAFLATAFACSLDEEFTHNGVAYRRVVGKLFRRLRSKLPDARLYAENLETGDVIDVAYQEDNAFWTWAIIETLRHTGIRIEELLELTHLALVSYRLPGTGEVVPLLQIVPSKSNEERLLLVTPELASVLASVISRLRAYDGQIPLTARYDGIERTTSAPLPHLFPRRSGWRFEVISQGTVLKLLRVAVARTGIVDQSGQPLRYTPHDFRRMFATEAVTGGLPVHIAARILGHANINTTQAYRAVFHDDLVRAYRAFIDSRRAVRPTEEYRQPTDAEWNEFQQHFELRKLELGTCGRPYGTPCNHEHACIRCPMMRIDPRAEHRLAEIIANLTDRIGEAHTNGWFGEVDGLETSRRAAEHKLAAIHRTTRNTPGATNLGIPTLRAEAT